MRRNSLIKRLTALTVTGILCLSSAFGSWAADGSKGSLPFEVILDINNRKTPIYDGYTQYVTATGLPMRTPSMCREKTMM